MKNVSTLTIVLIVTNVLSLSALMLKYRAAFKCPAVPATCCPDNCYPANCDTSSRFNLDLAYNMVEHYRENHWIAINANCPTITGQGVNDPNKIDARCAWFSLETLKKFINTIETKSCLNKSCATRLDLGIRIYYAEYPMDQTEFNLYGFGADHQDYKGLHTLLMIPTYHDNKQNADVDFDPEQMASTSCTGSTVFDTTALSGTICALAPDVAAQNHGGLAPPPDFCQSYWYTTGAVFMKYVDYRGGASLNNCPQSR